MSLQTRKRKISKVTNAFRKTVAIALDKPAFGQSSDCLTAVEWLSWSRKDLLSLKIGEKLFNFQPLFLVTYQSLKLRKFSMFQSTLQDKLVNWECKKESFQSQDEYKGLASLERPNNCSCILWEWRNQSSTPREEGLC